MFRLRLVLSAALALLCLATTAFAADKPPFPRLAGVNNGGPHDYEDPDYQARLAKLNFSVLNYWVGWDQSHHTTMERVVRNIKAINPESKVFLYENSMEVAADNAAAEPIFRKVEEMNWWVFPRGPDGERLLSPFGSRTGKQNYLINTTLFTPHDKSGYQQWEWHARWVVEHYYKPNPSIAGFFEDNVFWRPRVDGDWNRDGVTDSHTSPETGRWLREGYRKRFALLHKLMPGKLIIGNVADWGRKQAVLTELEGTLNGGVIEALLGEDHSVEHWASWAEMMRWYRKTLAAMAEPKLVAFHQIGTRTDYQAMRYGLASCLMDDGYFAYTEDSYNSVPWFDEFDADLGQAISPPATAPWQKGVYRRDFENGIALVNPRGNGPVEVELEGEFRRIDGKQVPTVNNGQRTRKVKLNDRDGIILLRVKPQRLPSAPKLIAVR